MYRRAGVSGLVEDLQAAITRMENTNLSYNNPCALTAGPGAVGTAPNGIALFPDLITGQAACTRQIQRNIDRGLTLEEFFAGKPGVYPGYAPAAAGNDPVTYAANVSRWTGITPGVPLNQISIGDAVNPSAVLAGGEYSPWLIGGAILAAGFLWVMIR